jgi:type VI secretion system secreted protein VgrG
MAADPLSIRLESTDFDAERVQIYKVVGREAISRLFSFDIECVCPDGAELSPDDVAGCEAALVIERDGLVLRKVHGMIAEVEDMLDTEPSHRTYRLLLVPRAHRLTLVETQEVFLGLSVPDILKQKLELVGLGSADVEMRLTGTYEPREFVVQYKETDLAFVSRLTEHLGISFFFEHTDDRDKIIFTDQAAGFRPVPGAESVAFHGRGEGQGVHRLTYRTRVVPKTYVQQDYNYRTPRLELTTAHKAPSGFAGGVVEYGAHVKTPTEAAAMARVRAEERRSHASFFAGESAVPEFGAGATFQLTGHPRREDAVLLLAEVEHRMTQAVLTHGNKGENGYSSTFRATDARETFRPARVTPRPRISGVVTGVVEPPEGGDVAKHADIDDQGRYTVRFYFDTSPPGERRKSSRPIRMIQPHAGPNYGIHFPLHPGVEVAVTFVDGDPDRPLIQGSVPNPVTPSPVTRKNALQSRIQTSSGLFIVMKDR